MIFLAYKLFKKGFAHYETKDLFVYDTTDVRRCTKCNNKQRKFEGYNGVEWNTFKKTPDCKCSEYVVA